ncbi:hypothetical protein HN014_13435 [Aquimarina sp. TRL1]|uniref:hypothetical protein n=1 Tax=Aquimarina sp. (strain TRL1) TaxID=2736252 RepID=UPI00158B5239|nr:hypothetical protein [Aquimarina sp. TRL1]QKX05868.1 hypothetical protein HN014_13435 [Aquimarina sp. TRL1]
MRKTLLLALASLAILSCERSKLNSENENIAIEDANSFEKESDNVEIVLHRTFSKDVSKEEALAQFEQATKDYIRKEGQNGKFPRSILKYRVITKTSNINNHGTDGIVHARVKFQTDRGVLTFVKRLDRVGINDFEEGNTDYFLLKVNLSNPICWATIQSTGTAIGLKGTDGWGVDRFHVDMTPQMQSPNPTSISGGSYMYSYPNDLLDSQHSYQWDKYEITQYQQTEYLTFGCGN